MDFAILGPLRALDEGRDITPAGSKRRALLALLLVNINETLPTERLIDELWGEHPPETAARTLQVHVSRLRKTLGAGNGAAGVIVTREHGYELTLDPERLDSHRFERLVAEGRNELASEHADRAVSAFEAALSLWRGAPLADFVSEQFAQGEIARLEDLRMAAIEDLNEAKLALGRHAELVGQLEALIGEYPYRERLRAQLMLTLYRCERQAAALQAYQDARKTLVEDLGIEPGERLRDLERAILAQDPDLAVAVPETAEPGRRRLPLPPTRTLGRDSDREEVRALLRRGDVRLVTLIGAGGVGKTRLALEVARRLEPELEDGAWFVSLAAIANAEHVASAIAQTLEATPLEGENPDRTVERFLAPKDALLVLDNFEHLLPAAPLITELLAAAPALTLLATSREPLRLHAEYRYAVAPLEVPADAEPAAVTHAAAGALFVERAASHDRAFELTADNAGAVAEICRRLDGLPLAIELAAARTTVLSPEELATRLAGALDILGHGPRDAPDRQRTLRATIEWSHDLLSAAEAEAFARFAVIAGGATTEAVQTVTGADIDALHGLIDKQLLLRRHESRVDGRLWMLETVREYALEQLDADPQAAEIRDRHCRYYLALAERAEPHLFTRGEPEWLPKLDAEADNFRAALDWSVRNGDPSHGLRLAGLLCKYWDIRNMAPEGLDWLESAIAAAGDGAPSRDRALARRAQVHLLADQGVPYETGRSLSDARSKAAEALAISREAAEPAGVADALLAMADLYMAESFPQRRRRALVDEALEYARKADEHRLVALALMDRANTVPPDSGTGEFEQAASALRKLGCLRILVAHYSSCAYSAIKVGSPERARPLLAEAVPLARELGVPAVMALTWGNAGLEALLTDDLDRARKAFDEELRLCREHVMHQFAGEGLGGLAAIATRRDALEQAAVLLGAANATRTGVGDADVTAQLEEQFFTHARAAYGTRDWDEAQARGAQMSVDEAIAFALGESTAID